MNIEGAVAFAALFAALYAGHTVGDHWVQTSCQAVEKVYGNPMAPGPVDKRAVRRGQLACLRHVVTLTATKLVFATAVVLVFHVKLSPWQAVAAVLVDAVSHYWADRRWTLEELARFVGKGEFYKQGTDLVDATGQPRPHVGTGKYALDQSWHIAWLFVAALVATA